MNFQLKTLLVVAGCIGVLTGLPMKSEQEGFYRFAAMVMGGVAASHVLTYKSSKD